MPADDNTRLAELHDHYKDTFQGLQASILQREKFFLLTVLLTILLVLRTFSPDVTANAVAEFLKGRFGLPHIDTTVFGSALWFGLLYSVLRYSQIVVLIDRRYPYLHRLEGLLGAEYNNNAFTREGQAYLENYPKLQSWASGLYTFVFPLTLMLVVALATGMECFATGPRMYLIFNISIGLLILVSLVLYLYYVRVQKPKEEVF
jgi:hypothetical protein